MSQLNIFNKLSITGADAEGDAEISMVGDKTQTYINAQDAAKIVEHLARAYALTVIDVSRISDDVLNGLYSELAYEKSKRFAASPEPKDGVRAVRETLHNWREAVVRLGGKPLGRAEGVEYEGSTSMPLADLDKLRAYATGWQKLSATVPAKLLDKITALGGVVSAEFMGEEIIITVNPGIGLGELIGLKQAAAELFPDFYFSDHIFTQDQTADGRYVGVSNLNIALDKVATATGMSAGELERAKGALSAVIGRSTGNMSELNHAGLAAGSGLNGLELKGVWIDECKDIDFTKAIKTVVDLKSTPRKKYPGSGDSKPLFSESTNEAAKIPGDVALGLKAKGLLDETGAWRKTLKGTHAEALSELMIQAIRFPEQRWTFENDKLMCEAKTSLYFCLFDGNTQLVPPFDIYPEKYDRSLGLLLRSAFEELSTDQYEDLLWNLKNIL